MGQRETELANWLKQVCQLSVEKIRPIAGGASCRRYYRLSVDAMTAKTTRYAHSLIVMDDPPPDAACHAFVAVQQAFLQAGLQVPVIFEQDLEKGFLLLGDFGDDLYHKLLNSETSTELYQKALLALSDIHSLQEIPGLSMPILDKAWMMDELQGFQYWFLQKHLRLSFSPQEQAIIDSAFSYIVEKVSEQPYVVMHRDYHSKNLMCLDGGGVGILDFQSAMYGPITYDAASLLRDCYIVWPQPTVKHWLKYFYDVLCEKALLSAVSFDMFCRWFDVTALQRHLKAILTFSRKLHRDHDASYMKYVPDTLNYIQQTTLLYSELASFSQLLENKMIPALTELSS